MQKKALVIFVKTLELTPVKTRLARSIGKTKADEFYALSINALEECLKAINSDTIAYWAIAEENGLDHDRWKNKEKIWQGEGGLGERLHKVYSELLAKYKEITIIGSDSPQLSIDDLVFEFKDFAVGLSLDGGFYLFAGKKPISAEIWHSISYSTSSTGSELAKKLQSIGSVQLLKKTFDVDTYEDLLLLKKHLEKDTDIHTSPTHRKLCAWLQNLVK